MVYMLRPKQRHCFEYDRGELGQREDFERDIFVPSFFLFDQSN